jgi:hypothetical protein
MARQDHFMKTSPDFLEVTRCFADDESVRLIDFRLFMAGALVSLTGYLLYRVSLHELWL